MSADSTHRVGDSTAAQQRVPSLFLSSSVWWVNGQEVIGIDGDRQTVIDDGVSKRLTLKKGPDIVRCAVINAGGARDFCARFLDPNEEPCTGFSLSVDSAHP